MLYLVFNEGYAATEGDLVRGELCDEAIRLARLLDQLVPGESETTGLLALELLQHARRDARTDPARRARRPRGAGPLPVGPSDDRRGALAASGAGSERRPYRLQAAIAACHASAPRPEDTDWPRIASLYGELLDRQPSPVIELNRAVAVAMADGPDAGLRLLEPLEASLARYHLFHAARADLLRRAGREDAADAYRRAIELVSNDAERRYLAGRLASLGA